MRGLRSPEAGGRRNREAVSRARSFPLPIWGLPLSAGIPQAIIVSRSQIVEIDFAGTHIVGSQSHRKERLSCAGWSSACSGFFYFKAVPSWMPAPPPAESGIPSPCIPGHGVDEAGQPPMRVWWFCSWPQSRRARPRMQRRGAARALGVTERALYAAVTCSPFSTTSPVSSRDLRLERTRGQPPETAWMNFDSGRSMLCVTVSFTASPMGSSSMMQRE